MPADKTTRIVVDTNLAISAAILKNSVSNKAFSLALKHFQLVSSESTLAELIDVIYRPKFNKYLTDEARLEFLTLVAQASEIVRVTSVITDCIDPKDNQFLSLAVDAGAGIILSGDPHLTDMNPYRGIKIIGPKAFIEKIS
jgi:putative PIN family toxin of toxin-antitoxin system